MESTPLRYLHGLLLVSFIVACVGCAVLQARSAVVRDDTPGQAIGPEKVTPEELRASVMGFVETYSAVMSQAADDLLQHGQPTPERRLMAQLAKLASVESAVTIATSPNPMTALLDLMVLLALQRQTWEEYWMPRIWGEDGRPMLAATTRLEAEIWRIGAHALFPAQLEQVRGLIAQMRTQYEGQTYVTSMRASDFAKERLRSVTNVEERASLLSLFALDPLSGLTPATREIAETRATAERIFFWAQRAPTIMNWHVEALMARFLATPEMKKLLADLDRVSASTDRVVKVAGELVPQVSAERMAAIHQILDGVKTERRALVRDLGEQREAIFRDLEQRQEPLRSILAEVRATVDAGDRLSASVQTLLELVRSMAPPEDGARPTSRPFDIRKYQATADSATKTITQLNEVLLTARAVLESPVIAGNGSRLQTVVDQSRAEVQGVIDSAYRKGLALIVAFAIALFVALTGARVVGTWLGARLAGRRRQEPN